LELVLKRREKRKGKDSQKDYQMEENFALVPEDINFKELEMGKVIG